MKELHAGPVNGGKVDFKFPLVPCSSRLFRTGKCPSFAHGFIKSKVAPSKPMTIILTIPSPNKNYVMNMLVKN